MNLRNNLLLAFIAFLFTITVRAEEGRYVVFFTDKENNLFSLDRPAEFLSPAALQRREKQGLTPDESDLPVSRNYLDQIEQKGIRVYFSSKWFNAALIETDSQKLSAILDLPFVRHAEFVAPGAVLQASQNKNSRKEEALTGLFQEVETDLQNRMIGIDRMHREGYTGQGMLIGVFDSGFSTVDQSPYFNHLFAGGRISGSRDFIRNSQNVYQYDSHGTKVLSVLAAFREGEYIGAAYGASYLLCVTEDVRSEFRVEEYNWLFAAEYADSIGVDIINSSVGYYDFDDERMNYTYDEMDGNTAVITLAATMASSKGIVIVCSNGNEGNRPWRYISAPADAEKILSVGAVGPDLSRAGFSSFGPTSDGRIKPDVAALGSWTRLASGENTMIGNGTSFASPLVAGLAAGLWQAFPELSSDELIRYIRETSSNAASPDTLTGYGIPHFISAFNRIVYEPEGEIERTFIVFPNPVDDRRIIYIYNDTFFGNQTAEVSFYATDGRLLHRLGIDLTKGRQPYELDVSVLHPGTYILTCNSGGDVKKSKLLVL